MMMIGLSSGMLTMLFGWKTFLTEGVLICGENTFLTSGVLTTMLD